MTEVHDNQQDSRLARFYRRAFLIYLSFIAFATVLYGVLNIRIRASWPIGDWLINYRGGFVRRGLPGEAVLGIARTLHLSPSVVVTLIQLFFYAIIFYVVWKLLAVTNWSLWLVLLLFSPATLAFPVLDPTAGYRKEIILFAGLGVLLLWLLRGVGRDEAIAVYLALLCVVCVLSHEALLIFFPYLVAAVWIVIEDPLRVLKISVVPAIATLLAAYLVVRHPGDSATADAICASIGEPVTTPLSGLCRGSIAALSSSTAMARLDVMLNIHVFHYYTLYSVTGLLALLPVFMAYAVLWRYRTLRRGLVILAGAACVSSAMSSTLFYYATDWGRWIYIHLVCISLLLMMLDYRRQSDPDTAGRPPALSSSRGKNIAVAVFMLAYVVCWDLPHVGAFSGRFGYFGLAHYVLTYRSHDHAVRL